MPQSRIVVLNGGGLRSLTALATVAGKQRVATIFVHDGRTATDYFHHAARDQGEHYEVDRKPELAMPHLRPPATDKQLERPQEYAPMAPIQMIIAAAGAASRMGADKLIWPIQPGPDYEQLAALTESLILIDDMIQATLGEAAVRIETPFLELTDRQLIEVGHQIDVPWQLARTCIADKRDACHRCWGCYRRRKAFEEAGIEDPLPSPIKR